MLFDRITPAPAKGLKFFWGRESSEVGRGDERGGEGRGGRGRSLRSGSK